MTKRFGSWKTRGPKNASPASPSGEFFEDLLTFPPIELADLLGLNAPMLEMLANSEPNAKEFRFSLSIRIEL